jgi:hypothetical protein
VSKLMIICIFISSTRSNFILFFKKSRKIAPKHFLYDVYLIHLKIAPAAPPSGVPAEAEPPFRCDLSDEVIEKFNSFIILHVFLFDCFIIFLIIFIVVV